MALIANVVRENLRNRVLYVQAGVSVLLMLAILTGKGSVVSDGSGRNLLDTLPGTLRVGFAMVGLLGALMTVVLSMSTIPREYERQTIHLLLVRPVARWQLAAAFLIGNILTAWVFLLALSLPLFAGLAARGGLHLAGKVIAGLVGPALNMALVGGVTTLLSTCLPGPAAGFLGLLTYGLSAFGSALNQIALAMPGWKGWLMRAGLSLLPPTDAVTAEVLTWLAFDTAPDARPFLSGLLYFWAVSGLTAAGLSRREV